MDYDYTYKHNIAKKTIITAEFLLDENDIDFILNYNMSTSGNRKKDRIYVNGNFYTLFRKPSLQIFPKEKQIVKLELELCEG